MAEKKIDKGDLVVIMAGQKAGEMGEVINEFPAELGEDLVEIRLNGNECICLEKKHLQIAE